jgi:hypothetical protein
VYFNLPFNDYNLNTSSLNLVISAMNRDEEVLEIYHRDIDIKEKIRLLEDIALDLHNELEAQDQNMHPEMHNKLSEGMRLATDFLRELHAKVNKA